MPASKDITQPEIEKGSFELSDLQKYDDSYLAEWDVKDWELNYTQASDICKGRIGERGAKECKRLVEQLNGYNTQLTLKSSHPRFLLAVIRLGLHIPR